MYRRRPSSSRWYSRRYTTGSRRRTSYTVWGSVWRHPGSNPVPRGGKAGIPAADTGWWLYWCQPEMLQGQTIITRKIHDNVNDFRGIQRFLWFFKSLISKLRFTYIEHVHVELSFFVKLLIHYNSHLSWQYIKWF